MRYFHSTLLCVLVVLAGCGGGGGSNNTTTVAPDVAGGKIDGYVYANPASRGTGTVPVLRVSAKADTAMAPVSGANVTVTDQNLTASSRADGYFLLENVATGSHQVTISHPQYRDPITVSVTVRKGQISSITPALGVGYYICAGVANYVYLPAADQLHGPPNDVHAISNVLFHSFYGNGSSLIDADATKAGIQRAILSAAGKMTADDFLIFYFSGHGASIMTTDGEVDAICPEDLKIDDFTTYISDTELRDWLMQLPDPKRSVVILDSCYAGGFMDSVRALGSNVRSVAPLQLPRALKGVGCTVLSASASDGLAYESNAQGIFTKYLASGLGVGKATADANHDHQVSAQEVFDYAASRTTADVPMQHPQCQAGENPVLLRY